jgi:hypothetical protein
MKKIVVIMAGLAVCAVNAATVYVSPDGRIGGDGRSWENAVRSVQGAINIAKHGDEIVVTNGVYASFKVENKAVTIRSVNGAEHTVVDGGKRDRCAHFAGGIATNSVLTGFTLRNGLTAKDIGGGVKGGTLYDCILTGNEALSGIGGGAAISTLNNCVLIGNKARLYGGGAEHCTLNHCVLIGNTANAGGGAGGSTLNNCVLVGNMAEYGGGVGGSTLNNCVLVGNTADYGKTHTGQGGGSYRSTLNNCIVWGNSAWKGDNHYDCTFNHSCTTPLPSGGTGNIAEDPMFVDAADGFFQLQRYSPCIDKGNNEYASGDSDLDGNPRIRNGRVDMGAYEYADPDKQGNADADAVKPPVRIVVPKVTKLQRVGPVPANSLRR